MQANLSEEPAHLRAVICGPRPKKRRRKKRTRKSDLSPELYDLRTPVVMLAEMPVAPNFSTAN